MLDSFGFTTIHSIAGIARLCGENAADGVDRRAGVALTVIDGIQPDVALAMARLGMGTGSVATAVGLEEGVA